MRDRTRTTVPFAKREAAEIVARHRGGAVVPVPPGATGAIVLSGIVRVRFIRSFAAVCWLWLALWAAPAAAGTVALTFDDLPLYGRWMPADDGMAVTAALLAGLRRHHDRATGFVNEIELSGSDRPARIAMLRAWLDAGMDLGNHTYSHPSLTSTPVEAYIADTERGAVETGALLRERGRRERWFRHPYLETGATLAARRTFEAWLADHGYCVAPVTMENADWQFATAYDDAIARRDAASAEHIRRSYLDHTARVVAWYRAAARQLLGREPAYVFLLHASRLNAASVDDLAAILDRAKLRVVPLARAMRDPAYRIADPYVGPNGIEWLERWSLALHRDLPFGTMPAVPADIVAADARLETATPGGGPPAIGLNRAGRDAGDRRPRAVRPPSG